MSDSVKTMRTEIGRKIDVSHFMNGSGWEMSTSTGLIERKVICRFDE